MACEGMVLRYFLDEEMRPGCRTGQCSDLSPPVGLLLAEMTPHPQENFPFLKVVYVCFGGEC